MWTHAQLLADVRRAANLFAELAGDEPPRVAMLLPPIPQAYFTLWGGEAAGVVCPINFLLNAAHIAELIDAARRQHPGGARPEPGARHLVARAGAARAPARGCSTCSPWAARPDALTSIAQLAAMPGDAPRVRTPAAARRIAALFHTGGTTGAPKLAQHTHGNQLHARLGRGADVRDATSTT